MAAFDLEMSVGTSQHECNIYQKNTQENNYSQNLTHEQLRIFGFRLMQLC